MVRMQVLTAQGVRTLPERLMDTGVIPNAVLAYALGRVGEYRAQTSVMQHRFRKVGHRRVNSRRREYRSVDSRRVRPGETKRRDHPDPERRGW